MRTGHLRIEVADVPAFRAYGGVDDDIDQRRPLGGKPRLQRLFEFIRRPDEVRVTAKRFDDVYGLVYEPDNNPTAPIETVRLKVSPSMLPYLHSLPIHSSQVIEGDVITLHLIINPELENRIMSYGEHIEVLSPLSLRESIKNRIQKMLSNYK